MKIMLSFSFMFLLFVELFVFLEIFEEDASAVRLMFRTKAKGGKKNGGNKSGRAQISPDRTGSQPTVTRGDSFIPSSAELSSSAESGSNNSPRRSGRSSPSDRSTVSSPSDRASKVAPVPLRRQETIPAIPTPYNIDQKGEPKMLPDGTVMVEIALDSVNTPSGKEQPHPLITEPNHPELQKSRPSFKTAGLIALVVLAVIAVLIGTLKSLNVF